jgi:hypothetical protein
MYESLEVVCSKKQLWDFIEEGTVQSKTKVDVLSITLTLITGLASHWQNKTRNSSPHVAKHNCMLRVRH